MKRSLLTYQNDEEDEESSDTNSSNENNKKKRIFKEIKGLWNCSILIKLPENNDHLDNLQDEIFEIHQELIESKVEKINRVEEIHISLSKLFSINYHLINTLYLDLIERLKQVKRFKISLKDCKYKLLTNDSNETNFGAACFQDENILNLIGLIDNFLKDHGFEPYYKDPIVHISFVYSNSSKNKVEPVITEKPCSVNLDNQLLIDTIYFKASHKYLPIDLN